MAKMVFGCGYLGLRVARNWAAGGEPVYVLTRSQDRAKQFAHEGLRPLVGDLTKPASLPNIPPVETVLFAVGFDRASGHSIHEVYVDGLTSALAALTVQPLQIIYISSTGVYGQDDGSWVDEASPCEPTRAGGRACLAAEELLRGHPLGERAVVLRLAGLYGPGRIPRADALASGAAIEAPSDGFMNLIHVDDAARVVEHVAARQPPENLYLVSDGHPVLRRHYFRELARLLAAPPPRFVQPLAESHAAQRAAADKRISNRRMVEQLAVELAYPTYRAGLAAIVAQR